MKYICYIFNELLYTIDIHIPVDISQKVYNLLRGCYFKINKF